MLGHDALVVPPDGGESVHLTPNLQLSEDAFPASSGDSAEEARILEDEAADTAVDALVAEEVAEELAAEAVIADAVAVELAEEVLARHGHQVVTAAGGADAVATYRSQPVDLVLMDVQMPEMDGFEATTAIREKEEQLGRHTPIIAMAAGMVCTNRILRDTVAAPNTPATTTQGMDEGDMKVIASLIGRAVRDADGFEVIHKPLDFDAFLDRVRCHLDQPWHA